MSLHRHISIANAALASGFIDPPAFLEVMRSMGSEAGTVEDFWLRSGRLTSAQLASAIELIDAAAPAQSDALRDTLLVVKFPEGTEPDDSNLEIGDTTAQIQRERPIPRIDTPPSRLETRHSNTRVGEVGDRTKPEIRIEPGPPPAAPPRPRYEMLGVLGSGGIGEVMECRDPRLARTVAVKQAKPDLRNDPATHRILEREARIIASLEHPNIIPLYDAGNRPGVGPYYVMRQVHQPTLDTVLARLHAGDPGSEREYGLKRLLRYFVQICNAVDYAHNRGVIHCDLKPANILLGDFGDVLVVDWGLAHSVDDPLGPRGGTPGYMAPEQLDRDSRNYDARTDVFALGSILYQMVCHEQAFPDAYDPDRATSLGSTADDPIVRYIEPTRPSELAPRMNIPPEVEEICMRAIELDPDDRFGSARELAVAIDDFLEGTRELERRQSEADRFAEVGDELAERYHEFDETRPEMLASLAELRERIAPWSPTDDKQELWNAEDMLNVTDALRARTLQAAVSSYEQAIDAIPTHREARRGLARLYWAELKRARLARYELEQIHFEQLVQRYDDGTHVTALGNEGRLTVSSAAGVEVTLFTLREQNRRLVPVEDEVLAERPMAEQVLASGSYVVEARAGGRLVSYPVLILPGSEVHLDVDVAATDDLGVDEVVVPGGRALLGGSPLLGAEDPREVDVAQFAISRYPVTFNAYLEFLEWLRASSDGSLEARIPSSSLGAPYWRFSASQWVPAAAAGALGERTIRALPVFGVSAESAERYAVWLSEQTGRCYRLPTDDEWEKAARGTDGRAYPWGDHFDATFCKMRNSRKGPSFPEPPGGFEFDESPYGVRDMAGGVADWTTRGRAGAASAESSRIVSSRGGSWLDGPLECALAARRAYVASERAERVGFRLVRSVMVRSEGAGTSGQSHRR